MCLAIPGKIVELVADCPRSGVVEVTGVRRRVDLGLLQDDLPAGGRLGADPRRLRHEQDQRARGRRSDAHARGSSARTRRPWRKSAATAWRGRMSREIRRRVPRPRPDRPDGRRDPPPGRSGPALPPDGSLRRPHPRHLSLRPQGRSAAEHRTDPRARLPGLRAADGADRRRAGDGAATRRHLRRLRRHDARARRARQPARAQGARAWTSASSIRRPTR